MADPTDLADRARKTPPVPAAPATSPRAVAQPGAITRNDVAHVARLARLTLADDELDLFTDQLGAVLAHARDVEALDVADVPPMSHPYPLVNVLRDDTVGPTVDRDEVLAAAPAVEDGRFRVPAILGEEP
jgi:aspartyl-tRNA(Asn)/glutamyl-tRNA(Gln) amidotransferase subunit C